MEILEDQELETWMKTDAFSMKSCFFDATSVKFLIHSLMKKIKTVGAEKEEFDYRDVSIVVARFGNFGLSGLWRKAQSHQFFDGSTPVFLQISGLRDLDEIIEPGMSGEKTFQH